VLDSLPGCGGSGGPGRPHPLRSELDGLARMPRSPRPLVRNRLQQGEPARGQLQLWPLILYDSTRAARVAVLSGSSSRRFNQSSWPRRNSVSAAEYEPYALMRVRSKFPLECGCLGSLRPSCSGRGRSGLSPGEFLLWRRWPRSRLPRGEQITMWVLSSSPSSR